MALRGVPFERARRSLCWDRQTRRTGEHGRSLHTVDFLRTVIDGGVHVFKGTLESDVFDS
jgi:hypothetical protein